jgi:hypothetical protein
MRIRFVFEKAAIVCVACFLGFVVRTNQVQAGVSNFRLFKEAYYTQTGPGAVDLAFWAMDANIQALPDDAANIVFTPPAPGVVLSDAVVDEFWEVFFSFPTRAALDSAYPDGTYLYEISGGSVGTQVATLTMPENFFPVDIPLFSADSFLALNSARPGSPVTLEWNSFVPDVRSLNARVRLGLHDHTSGDFPIFEGNLPTTTTSFEIPANTLKRGHEYEVFLIFSNAIRTPNDGFGNGTSLVDANRSVAFTFTAVPEPSSLALLGMGIAGLARRAVCRRRRRS